MKKLRNAIVTFSVALGVTTVVADAGEMKPGLWEVHPIVHVVDGVDRLAQGREALAKIPAEQRKTLEKSFLGISQVCLSAEAVSEGLPMVGQAGDCKKDIKKDGATTRFEYQCKAGGIVTTGKGERVIKGENSVLTRSETNRTGPDGNHTYKSESEMVYIQPNCPANDAGKR